MSIYAFVQSADNDGTVVFAKNGEYIDKYEEVNEYINQMEKFFELASNQKRPTYIKNKDQHIFVGFHNEKDNSNRKREFLVCWDSTDSKDMILETVKRIGVTDEFDYDNLKKKELNKNIFFYIAIIGMIVILYKIFQK